MEMKVRIKIDSERSPMGCRRQTVSADPRPDGIGGRGTDFRDSSKEGLICDP